MGSKSIKKDVYKFSCFRSKMGMALEPNIIKAFWGKDYSSMATKSKRRKNIRYSNKKVEILKQSLDKFIIFDWVLFIGITGSVASGTVKKEDDIDVFIVLKNDRMWLYRGLMLLRLGYNSVRRVWGKNYTNKIDTNFICEERGLLFDSDNIFYLHELIYMIPVYCPEYYNYILGLNYKLLRSFSITQISPKSLNKKRFYLYMILDKIAFFIQYIYMFLLYHKPDTKRLLFNNRVGRIEFFPKDFSKKKIMEYEQSI